MDFREVLEKIGLTKNESKVYLTLLELGPSLAGKIAKISELHRRPTYDSLTRLLDKGLISYTIKSGKKYFQAVNPERFISILKEKQKSVEQIIPSLLEKFYTKKPEITTEVYEGKEGIKTIMEDIIKTKKEFLTIGSTGKGPSIFPYYVENFSKRREKAKIKRKVLIADTLDGRKHYGTLKKEKLVEVKFLPREIKNVQTTWIYGDKVAIILVSEEYPIATLIENKQIADNYRFLFSMIWKVGKS